MKRNTLVVVGGLALLGTFILDGSPALANSSPETHDWDPVVSWYEDRNASPEDISSVLTKLESGQPLESWNPEATPVASDRFETLHESGTLLRFSDGSMLEQRIEKPVVAGVIGPMSITGCSTMSSGIYAHFSNCLISQGDGIKNMSFRATYTRWATGAGISSWWDPMVSTAYGSATAPTFSFTRPNASGSLPAVVTSFSVYTSAIGGGTETLYLSLRVTSSSAWTTTY